LKKWANSSLLGAVGTYSVLPPFAGVSLNAPSLMRWSAGVTGENGGIRSSTHFSWNMSGFFVRACKESAERRDQQEASAPLLQRPPYHSALIPGTSARIFDLSDTTADEAIDRACALADASRLAATSGATIKAFRVLDRSTTTARYSSRHEVANVRDRCAYPVIRRHLCLHMHDRVYICMTEPSEKVALEMVGIR
jgi:hypothetical protein